MLEKHLFGLYEKALPAAWDWTTRLLAVKELGFDYMEISIDETDERIGRLYWNTDEMRQLQTAIQETGVPLRSMCLSAHRRFPFGSADPAIRDKAYELMRLAIEFSDALGIKVIQLAGYDVYYEASTEDSRAAFLEGLRWSCSYAAKYSVMLAMEIMDTPFLNSITKNLWYEQQLRSPWYGVYPDLGNLTAWGNNVDEELEKGIHSIVAVHCKDTLAVTPDFPGKFKCVGFGTGCVDFTAAFRKLEGLGYTGPFMVEMWADPATDCMAEVRKAKRFLEEKYQAGLAR
jgi:hexulose-6-phosphate isomerase